MHKNKKRIQKYKFQTYIQIHKKHTNSKPIWGQARWRNGAKRYWIYFCFSHFLATCFAGLEAVRKKIAIVAPLGGHNRKTIIWHSTKNLSQVVIYIYIYIYPPPRFQRQGVTSFTVGLGSRSCFHCVFLQSTGHTLQTKNKKCVSFA